MPIRVIAGEAKGRNLKMVPGSASRPVMDRVKEACFNILGTGIVNVTFLDLFAGTGSVGIEALSRGAAHCTFIDNYRVACKCIKENLELTGFSDRATLLCADAFDFLRRPVSRQYEIVYIAPPQYKEIWKDALVKVDRKQDLLAPDALVIVQIDPAEYAEQKLERLELYDQRTYGNTMLNFYEWPVEE